MVKRKRAKKPHTPLMVDLRTKMLKNVYHRGQLKTSFQKLKSEINTGLPDAEDVFNSLSVPLMKLVGLKTEEMARKEDLLLFTWNLIRLNSNFTIRAVFLNHFQLKNDIRFIK